MICQHLKFCKTHDPFCSDESCITKISNRKEFEVRLKKVKIRKSLREYLWETTNPIRRKLTLKHFENGKSLLELGTK